MLLACFWVPRLPAVLPRQRSDLPLPLELSAAFPFILAEFRQGVCDQRSQGAGGRLHQERAEEGRGSQL